MTGLAIICGWLGLATSPFGQSMDVWSKAHPSAKLDPTHDVREGGRARGEGIQGYTEEGSVSLRGKKVGTNTYYQFAQADLSAVMVYLDCGERRTSKLCVARAADLERELVEKVGRPPCTVGTGVGAYAAWRFDDVVVYLNHAGLVMSKSVQQVACSSGDGGLP